MSESTPEPIDLGEPKIVPTVVSPYRVTNNATGQTLGQFFEIISENGAPADSVLFEFYSISTRERLGVELYHDGTIHLGSWNTEGEWVEMYLCEQEGVPFDLAEFGNAQVAAVTQI